MRLKVVFLTSYSAQNISIFILSWIVPAFSGPNLYTFWKLEVSRDLETVIAQGPVLMQRLPQLLNPVGAQRLDPTFAGFAVFVDKVSGHGWSLYRPWSR